MTRWRWWHPTSINFESLFTNPIMISAPLSRLFGSTDHQRKYAHDHSSIVMTTLASYSKFPLFAMISWWPLWFLEISQFAHAFIQCFQYFSENWWIITTSFKGLQWAHQGWRIFPHLWSLKHRPRYLKWLPKQLNDSSWEELTSGQTKRRLMFLFLIVKTIRDLQSCLTLQTRAFDCFCVCYVTPYLFYIRIFNCP